jgi:Cytochrome P460
MSNLLIDGSQRVFRHTDAKLESESLMNYLLRLTIGVLLMAAPAGSPQSGDKGPVFAKDGSLVLPTGFRSWVFIGGPITPNKLNDGAAQFPEFHNVYIERENLRYYQKNGKFPEGTVMVKELVLTQVGEHPDGSLDSASGRGYFPSTLNGLDVMVKDSKRFAETNNWGFFTFGHHAELYETAAKASSISQCAYRHIANVAKTDMVWVQYYPLVKTKID